MRGAGRNCRALIASAMAQRDGSPLLVVVPTLEEAGRWTALLELMGWSLASLYPTSEGSPYEPFDPTSEIIWGQLQVLSDLLNDPESSGRAIVATERCLQPHLPPPVALKATCRVLTRGDEVELDHLLKHLRNSDMSAYRRLIRRVLGVVGGTLLIFFQSVVSCQFVLNFLVKSLSSYVSSIRQRNDLDPIDQLRLTPTGFNPLIADQLRATMPDGSVFLTWRASHR